jgi:hypothetical protein
VNDYIPAVIGLVGVIFGFLGAELAHFNHRRRIDRFHQQRLAEEETTIKVKRTKPSLRNPLITYITSYDEFKTNRGLYAPVKPKVDKKNDELEV